MTTLASKLLEYLSTSTIVLDNGLRCTYMNEAAERLIEMSRRSAEGRRIDELLPANIELAEQVRAVLAHGAGLIVRDEEVHIPIWQRSERVDYQLTRFETDDTFHVLIELSQIDRVTRMANDAEQSARYQAALAMVQGISHEIRNPLGGIRGAAQLLDKKLDASGLNQELGEYSQVIIREADRLGRLVSRLSAGHRTLQKTAVNIHQLIQHCIDLIAAEFGDSVVVERDYDMGLPVLLLDSEQIIQVILNILLNGAQAMEGEGQLTIRTRVALADATRNSMPTKGVRIQIQDTGAGVAPELRERVFFPMVTSRDEGTGLGLAIAQEIAQNHGGFIAVDEFWEGASFSLYLPFTEEATHG